MDKLYDLKPIIKNLGVIVLASLVIGLWFYLSDISIVPFMDSINEVTDRGVWGMFVLFVSIVFVIGYVVVISMSLYKIGLLIYELLMTTNDKTLVTTDIVTNDSLGAFNLTTHLNKKTSPKVKNAIVQFYGENMLGRNKGILSACIIEYMCDKGWVNSIAPGYKKLEDFLKNDLKLDSVGYQQLDKSHADLKDAIRAVNMYNDGKAPVPDSKEQDKEKLYKKFKEFMMAIDQ